MTIYGSYAGFKFYIKPKPLLGAYVAMETFARGLLKHGNFDEYHAYYDDGFFRTLTQAEMIRAYFRQARLKVLKLKDLVRQSAVDYPFLHFEEFRPAEEVVFRNLFARKNIPVTRRVYAVATQTHLTRYLDLCLLSDGARPYDSIIVPSKPTREVLMAYFADMSAHTAGRLRYRGRVDVIPHGIEIEQFQPGEKRASREKFGIAPEATVLLSVARLHSISKMNYDRFLEFLVRLVKRTTVKVVLVLAGSDPQNAASELVALAGQMGIMEHVKVIANFADESKADLLNCADIFMSVSDNVQESFGIALTEAMAMRLPVLCTDWDGYKDIVDDGITGYRIPTVWQVRDHPDEVLSVFRDPYDHSVIHEMSRDIHVDMDLLVTRALTLIDHPGIRERMGRRGREKVERMYSIKTEIAQCQTLWQELEQMARNDTNVYHDLSPLLNYNHPKHFRSYPTRFEQHTLLRTRDRICTREARGQKQAMV